MGERERLALALQGRPCAWASAAGALHGQRCQRLAGRTPSLPPTSRSRSQARVGRAFNPPSSMTDLSTQVKRAYTAKLLAFEQARRLPCVCGRT